MAGEYCFRPAHRLGRATGFGAVFSSRRVLRGKVFDLHYTNNDVGTARLGMVIPKRNVRLSVIRNRLKRLTRDVFRQRRARLPAFDLVVRLARLPASGMPDSLVLRAEIETLLGRLPGGVCA